ncbi:N-acyl-D-amino-acid deacylase family protein [Clostridium lundense]|uniref:N-acyl-D-amino-acid deacylase family protein n=1 Tax=Clostridium lundense TaxID=319475 RepID=UPI00047F29AC|nr:D-aminoacylase [Clostridium lundense]
MFDLVINNVLIIDGKGNTPFKGSIGIIKDKIATISKDYSLDGLKSIDGKDHILAPGFIDIHSHSDSSFLVYKDFESKIFQGITTELIGSCGISLVPNNRAIKNDILNYCKTLCYNTDKIELDFSTLNEYIEKVNKELHATNVLPQIGHGTLRMAVMGFENRTPTNKELTEMKFLLERELKSGAWGMSLGLVYPPGSFTEKEELVELSKVLKKYNAILTVHMRGEGDTVFDSVKEMIDITRESGVHCHISHLKLMGRTQWGHGKELLKLIEDGISEGLNISCDQYPYIASCTSLYPLIPKDAQEGGISAIKNRFNSSQWDSIAKIIEKNIYSRGGGDKIVVSSSKGTKENYQGCSLLQISNKLNISLPEVVKLLILQTEGAASIIYYSMNEEDVEYIMKQEIVAVGSDGAALSFNDSKFGTPHPRNFGTFPRYIRTCLDKKLLPLEKIIYKATGLPSKLLNLSDRGVIEVGKIADLVIFDLDTIEDMSTFTEPFAKPKGIEYVLVSGEIALENGVQNKIYNGKILTK